jgi:predicted site-specific integrase-resolvase
MEILTPEEFAKRLKIGRSTLFEWIRTGVLIPEKHFVRRGRILRFIWSDDVLFSLAEPKVQPKTTMNKRHNKTKLNWEY